MSEDRAAPGQGPVLVTGGAGFIGSHLVDGLVARGQAVRVLDDLSTGCRANLPASPLVELIEGDVAHAVTVERAVEGVSSVIHLAAIASVQRSVEDPVGTHRVNYEGTLRVLEAMVRHGVKRIVYASSAAVYGASTDLPLRETAPPDPMSPYGVDKLAGEYALNAYRHTHGLHPTALRFFNVYGPRQDPRSPYSGVISIFVRACQTGRMVTLFGDGQQTRDFVYVGDLVRVLLASLDWNRAAPKRVNVGTGSPTSLLEVLAELQHASGKAIPRAFAEPRPGDVRHSLAAVDRLDALMGARPGTPLRDGLRAVFDAGPLTD